MATELNRVLIALPLETYLKVVEHAAVRGTSMSKQGRYFIERALEFEGKPDYVAASKG